MITGTVAIGFDFEMPQSQIDLGLQTREGFLRKPIGCQVRMRRREGRENLVKV